MTVEEAERQLADARARLESAATYLEKARGYVDKAVQRVIDAEVALMRAQDEDGGDA